MDPARILRFLAGLSFRQAVWLFPIAFALHVAEELPRFTRWAQRYASPLYTQREYLSVHLGGIAGAVLVAGLLSVWPNRILAFVFFAFMFTPGLFFNVLFHVGATVYSGRYCPGLVTALVVYLPTYFLVTHLAYREGLLGAGAAAVAFVIAGVFHAVEVGHNVFKAW